MRIRGEMKIFLGFDDTDVLGSEMGTGKLVRLYEKKLPQEAKLWGVIRHQLLVDDRIPYTSHNSPACAVVEIEDAALIPRLIDLAAEHLEELCCPGSDPGLCVAREDADLSKVVEFALACTRSVMTQAEAKAVSDEAGIHLSGHGGTCDGIIGATAAVGLTSFGWSGRLLEFGGLRDLPNPIRVADLIAHGILPVPLDRDATVLSPESLVWTNHWLRPRFWSGRAILPLQYTRGRWVIVGSSRPIGAQVVKGLKSLSRRAGMMLGVGRN
jgi:hypothetical protein